MGLEEFSMGALYIPVIKKTMRSISYQAAKTPAQIVLEMDTVGEIKRYLFEQMRRQRHGRVARNVPLILSDCLSKAPAGN